MHLRSPLNRRGARSRTPRSLALIAILGVAALLLAACGDDNDDLAPAPVEATPAQETTPAAATPAPETPTPADATPPPADAPADEGETTIAVATEGPLSPYLVDGAGMTLYLFTNDEPGVSNCTDACLASWPALLIAEGEEPTAGEGATGELGVIEREDGTGWQVTYNGMPLYYWAADQAPGDTTGHEVGGVWFVVPPNGGGMGAAPSTQSTPAAGGSSPGY
jgi:predicted lipoprotein with Yx(FWY)xxD motif